MSIDTDLIAAAEDLRPHHPRAEVMEAVLARLDAEHGGAAGWLVERGLDEAPCV